MHRNQRINQWWKCFCFKCNWKVRSYESYLFPYISLNEHIIGGDTPCLSSYLGITPRICIKPSVLLSRYIKQHGSWEPQLVNNILKMVQRFPEATFLGLTKYFRSSLELFQSSRCSLFPPLIFLDLGSNVGVFTLSVAALNTNRSVVAVDADPVNLAYIRESLRLGGYSQNVRTINNAVGWVET